MTKEECEKALKALYDENGEMDEYASAFSFDDDYIPQCVYETAREHCYDTLKQLIHEHFDNPPLSFDDLKAGMWVWDDFWKKYRRIIRINKDQKSAGFEMWSMKMCSTNWVDFEENRFYRRQKEG